MSLPQQPPTDAQAVAWSDQFRAEFRNEAREIYRVACASVGVIIAYDEERWETIFDRLFEVGGNAMLACLERHGALIQAVR